MNESWNESERTPTTRWLGISISVMARVLLLLILVLVSVGVLTGAVRFVRHFWFPKAITASSHVAVLDVAGILVSSTSTVRDLEELVEDSGVKAIVIRVNSPGGFVAPSQEIYHAIKKADEAKPVLVSMGQVAASGGYYISLGARKIFANPGTLTASIGVIMEFMNTEKLYQWAKIQRFSITAGEMKDAGSPLKPMSPAEKKLFEDMLSDIHGQFRGAVSERRGLKDAELLHATDGRVMTGQQALKAKLVDSLGGLNDALSEAKKLAGLPDDAEVVYPGRDGGFLRHFFLGDDEEEASSSLESLAQHLSQATSLYSGWRVLWLSPVL